MQVLLTKIIILVASFTNIITVNVMEHKQINMKQSPQHSQSQRPLTFEDFVWQKDTIHILQTALQSAHQKGHTLGHMLLCWKSWYWKTTLASIVSRKTKSKLHMLTGYAINKPAEMVSLLNTVEKDDVVFIDEIHRLKAPIEEVLYIAMEDYAIDMVMPDGNTVKLPVEPFTLIGATTKSESLSEPLKNRFIYTFHLSPYSYEEKKQIVQRYLTLNNMNLAQSSLLETICSFASSTPREITTLCIQLRDYCIVHNNDSLTVDTGLREKFVKAHNVKEWWMSPVHIRYLAILKSAQRPVGLRTLSAKLWINEKALEHDIEPVLFQLGKVEKTAKGRIFVG